MVGDQGKAPQGAARPLFFFLKGLYFKRTVWLRINIQVLRDQTGLRPGLVPKAGFGHLRESSSQLVLLAFWHNRLQLRFTLFPSFPEVYPFQPRLEVVQRIPRLCVDISLSYGNFVCFSNLSLLPRFPQLFLSGSCFLWIFNSIPLA